MNEKRKIFGSGTVTLGFFVSLLKALRMIDGDSKYLNDEVMDFVFRQERLAVLQPSSIVLNQGVPETHQSQSIVYIMTS